MTTESTHGLLDELERLRQLLREEKDRSDLNQHIPVLTDVAEGLATGTEHLSAARFTPNTVTGTMASLTSVNAEPGLRTQLKNQAQLVIQEIIDEELVRVESRLNRELNSYLEHWLNQQELTKS
ncbi:hypothetical protein EOPP23_16490 [Endozoicomonas sp. OPT23]|uniref:hypothetical protein n=1 Tax=Endozoicomonas sp. OPT23 TaxID=2072845 RepID=UPI00129B161A|nr:hypothetical protein [Endozoicomonas sp. OPT23]MRI34585.1 hypothetical protein [Endozoicomonas sp. OPT23]